MTTKDAYGKCSRTIFLAVCIIVYWLPARLLLILLMANVFPATYSFSQIPGEWTWMHGDNTPNSPGVFGVQGVPNPANKPPALYEPCEWKDNNGNFWLFGGSQGGGLDATALWKFNPGTNQWTWMKGLSATNQMGVYGTMGTPAPGNYPGSRGWAAVTWTDASGNLWLFGGHGYDAAGGQGFLNDLWKYDISANEWTWMKGPGTINDPGSYGMLGISNPANLPPSRYETSCSWTDNADNLWLYGGANNNAQLQRYGDLWKYTISINEWTWMKGSNTLNTPAVYGTQGVTNAANTPGGRSPYASWTDLAGNLWLFGGQHYVGFVSKNDLWKYNIAANEWTWMKGPSTNDDPGTYGTRCLSATANVPPARYENRSRVRDACGNFWNFGGRMVSSGYFNDLWHYNISTNQWTWVSGDNIINQAAVYGTKGTSSPANKPGAKQGSVAWIDNNGYIWIFGGTENGNTLRNDLFRYIPDTNCIPSCNTTLFSTVTFTNILCNGLCNGTATAIPSNGTSPYTYSWNTIPIQTTANATGLCAGTYTVTVTDAIPTTVTATVTITQPVVLTSTMTSTPAICDSSNGTASVSAGGGSPSYTYSWNPSGGTNATATGLAAGTYTATVTDANGCTQAQTVTVVSSGSITASQSASICSGFIYTLPGGTIVSAGGIYIDTLISVAGCDSIITTALTVNPNPTATAFSSVTITQGQSVTLMASGGGMYSWSNGSNGFSITVTPPATTLYCVTVTDANNCTDTACVTITIEPIDCSNAGELYLPNAFSPNGDGENDKLQIYFGNLNCIKTFKFVIYNRWGEKVFETTNATFQWDGASNGGIMNTAAFVYYWEATLNTGENITQKGNISLIK